MALKTVETLLLVYQEQKYKSGLPVEPKKKWIRRDEKKTAFIKSMMIDNRTIVILRSCLRVCVTSFPGKQATKRETLRFSWDHYFVAAWVGMRRFQKTDPDWKIAWFNCWVLQLKNTKCHLKKHKSSSQFHCVIFGGKRDILRCEMLFVIILWPVLFRVATIPWGRQTGVVTNRQSCREIWSPCWGVCSKCAKTPSTTSQHRTHRGPGTANAGTKTNLVIVSFIIQLGVVYGLQSDFHAQRERELRRQ